MITIQRHENTLKVLLSDGPLNSTFTFRIGLSDEFYAELMRIHYQQKLDNAINSIRREAYEQGWKDAKQRKPKMTWFSCRF